MLNETFPNQPHDRRRRLPGIGAPEVGFALGFVAAVTGIALLSIPLALIVAGAFWMFAAWRLS